VIGLGEEWFPFRRRRIWSFFDEMMREIEEAFEREFEDIEKMLSGMPEKYVRERTLPDGSRVREYGPFVYGYSITIGPDGKPIVREFGNVKPQPYGRPSVSIREEREPLVDVITADDEVKVIAELPGVEKDDIKLEGTEDTLIISVDTPERKYYKEVKLPVPVDPEKAKSNYKNGVLEIILPRKGRSKGYKIKVE
jgi:HSP20 family protein